MIVWIQSQNTVTYLQRVSEIFEQILQAATLHKPKQPVSINMSRSLMSSVYPL